MSSDLETSLSLPLPSLLPPPTPPFPLSSEIDSFLEISLHGGKDGPHGSSISRTHSLHNRENFLSQVEYCDWQLEHMCLLDKPIRVILCEEKASSKGREMMPPPKLSIIMANLFFLI